MDYSVNYNSTKRKEAYEIRLPLGTHLDYIKNNPNKRFNIELSEITNHTYKLLDLIKEISSYTVRTSSLSLLQTLLNRGYNAYPTFPVSDWETFSNLKDLGVSDIYIDGPLGFQAKEIAAGKGDIKIRVSPTKSPNSALSANTSPASFFIRPEDIQLYSSFVDIIDFKEPNQEKEDALYSIYNKEVFPYDANFLISSFGFPIDNSFIKEEFAETRLNCRQICKIPTHSCHYCETYFKTASTLTELNKWIKE
jgi:hypothetical protein